MAFTIRGISFGEEVELTWHEGEIFGHEGRAYASVALKANQLLVLHYEPVETSP